MKAMNYISSILTSKVYDVAVVTPVDEAPAPSLWIIDSQHNILILFQKTEG